MEAWHFLKEDKCLQFGDKTKVKPGQWLRADGELEMCHNGMHASKRLIDALFYAPGPVVCRVEVRGEIEEADDKLVARERRVLWMFDATEVLRRFARRCALDVVHLWNPPYVVLQYLKTGDESIRAEARAAARGAARAAASAAAWDAARDAAWAAASAAASDASGATAWGVARARQNSRLTAMVVGEARSLGVYK